MAVSDATAEVARRVEGVPEDKLTVIANGIDIQAFTRSEADRARVRRGLGLSQDMLVVGSVGRLSPEKNYPLLLRATAELLGPEVRLVLVGDGPERERLSALVSPHVRPFVHFAGMQHDVAAWLSAFDVFALSSYTEGLPLVVPEAMAASLPVVCTAVGGLPGVIADGISGLLVPSGDATAFAEALRALVGSPAARIRYGAAGRDAVERRFSLARVVDAYAELYARGRGKGGHARRALGHEQERGPCRVFAQHPLREFLRIAVLKTVVDVPAERLESGSLEMVERAPHVEGLRHDPHALAAFREQEVRRPQGILSRVHALIAPGAGSPRERPCAVATPPSCRIPCARRAESSHGVRTRPSRTPPGPACARRSPLRRGRALRRWA